MAIAAPTTAGQAQTIGGQKYVSVADGNKFVFIKDVSVNSQNASITPVYDPLPAPQPIVTPGTMNGATLVSGVTGSPMVNGGKVHTLGRLSTPPAPNTWNTTLTISPVTGACKVRFAITSAIQGTIEVSIDGAAPLTASNVGFGWSGTTPAIVAFQNPDFTWFEVAIAQSSNPQSVKVTIPTGRGAIPCLYAPDAIISLKPTQPTGLILRAMPEGQEMIYRPSELAKKTDISIPTPPFDPTPLSNRISDLENRMWVSPYGLVAWSPEANLTSQLNSVHPSGGLMKEWVTEADGNAIDIRIGTGITAQTLKTELELPLTHRLVRVKSGSADALIANASAIPSGLYRLQVMSDLIQMFVLESAG